MNLVIRIDFTLNAVFITHLLSKIVYWSVQFLRKFHINDRLKSVIGTGMCSLYRTLVIKPKQDILGDEPLWHVFNLLYHTEQESPCYGQELRVVVSLN